MIQLYDQVQILCTFLVHLLPWMMEWNGIDERCHQYSQHVQSFIHADILYVSNMRYVVEMKILEKRKKNSHQCLHHQHQHQHRDRIRYYY